MSQTASPVLHARPRGGVSHELTIGRAVEVRPPLWVSRRPRSTPHPSAHSPTRYVMWGTLGVTDVHGMVVGVMGGRVWCTSLCVPKPKPARLGRYPSRRRQAGSWSVDTQAYSLHIALVVDRAPPGCPVPFTPPRARVSSPALAEDPTMGWPRDSLCAVPLGSGA